MRIYLPFSREAVATFFLLLTCFASFALSTKYADHSVLASGSWYKVAVEKDGVYKLTYDDFVDMGLINGAVSSSRLKIYGNGNGMLPENSTIARPDDLVENSIYIVDGDDHMFSSGDYVLFYGQGPTQWKYNESSGNFEHITNIYTDQCCYFVTVSNGDGMRIPLVEQDGGTPQNTIRTFSDYAVHELEAVNLIGTGREWYGELFDFETEYTFEFGFPNLVNTTHHIRSRIAARASSTATFSGKVHNASFSHSVSSVSLNDQDSYYAKTSLVTKPFICAQDEFSVTIMNDDQSGNTIGWIDFIELNATRYLRLTETPLIFHGPNPIQQPGIQKMEVGNCSSATIIWEVTNPSEIKQIKATSSGSNKSFVIDNIQLRQFVAFNKDQAITPIFKGGIANQDLHQITQVDYVIIAPSEIKEQASTLAAFHEGTSGLSNVIVSPNQIYNEFSSGVQDITAIRDFLKMIYDKSGEQSPRYVLFYGDGSYDYKDREENNSNWVPCWQSNVSLHYIDSYATDDYFGLLDDGETLHSYDVLDVGIGRLPVSSVEQAQQVLDKILHYNSNTAEVMKDWRNMICFVADDEESNSHMNQAEQLAQFVSQNYPLYNMDKIYLDAFVQESTPSGQRYPDVNQAINNRIKKGALIVNYTGHGGETGWTHEKVLTVHDINSWKNTDNMPVFVTATCEFSRFDDPKRTSAGEYVILNPDGGGIALFTTTRATYGLPNFTLNMNFYKYAFEKQNGEYPSLGDLIRVAKIGASSKENARKFILLGDPAMKMNYPEYGIVTDEVIDVYQQNSIDTVRALDRVIVKGDVIDEWGYVLSDFNGECQVKMYDKKQMTRTLSNGGDPEFYYESQNNIIYTGKALVKDGHFETEFIIPKDIHYSFGEAKLCYYAQNGHTDAAGFDNSIIVGGTSINAVEDLSGPQISLYMNGQDFLNGGVTDKDPTLSVYLEDESGINIMGTGIGHDMVMVLDDNYVHPVILNDFYEADWDQFGCGKMIYPFFNLDEGSHNIQLKVWDVYNNSSHASLDFEVVSSEQVFLENVFNYPNPFSEKTYFNFEHNQPEKDLDIRLSIYNLHGVLVKEFQSELSTSGYLSRTISWDGTGFSNQRLDNGMYLYQVVVETEEGISQVITKKLIFIK